MSASRSTPSRGVQSRSGTRANPIRSYIAAAPVLMSRTQIASARRPRLPRPLLARLRRARPRPRCARPRGPLPGTGTPARPPARSRGTRSRSGRSSRCRRRPRHAPQRAGRPLQRERRCPAASRRRASPARAGRPRRRPPRRSHRPRRGRTTVATLGITRGLGIGLLSPTCPSPASRTRSCGRAFALSAGGVVESDAVDVRRGTGSSRWVMRRADWPRTRSSTRQAASSAAASATVTCMRSRAGSSTRSPRCGTTRQPQDIAVAVGRWARRPSGGRVGPG